MIFFLQNSGACWNSSGLSWFPSVKPRRPDSSAPCWTSSSTWRRPRGRRWSCVSNALSGPRQRREPSYDKLWRYEGHKQKCLMVTNSTSATCDQQKVAFCSTFRDFLGSILYLEQGTTPPSFSYTTEPQLPLCWCICCLSVLLLHNTNFD